MKPTLAAFIFIVLCIVSCKSVVLEEPTDTEVDSLNFVLNPASDTSNPLSPTGGPGETQGLFENWFKECARTDAFKRSVYLGPTNPYYIGSILSKNLQSNKYDLSKIIPASDYQKFVTLGRPTDACNISKMKKFTISTFLGGTFFKTVNANLGGAIKNAKDTIITTGAWTVDYLNDKQFLDYLNDSPNGELTAYREYLTTSKNYIVTKIVKINGFSAKICTTDTLSPDLSLTLTNGFNFDVIPTDTTKKIGFTLHFVKSAKDTISISSTGEFLALAQVAKGKSINK